MQSSAHSHQRLVADTRGLSTVEYAVLFVMLLAGTVALWNSIGGELSQNVEAGAKTFDDAMSGALPRAAAAAARQPAAANSAGAATRAVSPGRPARAVNAATRGSGTGVSSAATPGQAARPGTSQASGGPAGAAPPTAAGGSAGAAPPTAAGAASGGHNGAAALPQAQTAPSAQQEDKGWYDSARDYVLDSRAGHLGLGIAYGTIGSFVDPLGFAPSPPGAGKDFEVGRAAGEVVTGIAQIYHGGAMVLGGAGLGGVGVAGAAPSAGTSTALIPAAVAAIGVGTAIATAGLSNAGRGIARGYNAMTMADEAPVARGGSSGGAPDGASSARAAEAPGGSAVPRRGGLAPHPADSPDLPGGARGRYNAAAHNEGIPRLPADYDVHHSIPQELRGDPRIAGIDIDSPTNTRGVRGSRSAPAGPQRNVHQHITNEWADFLRNNPNATRRDILEFRDSIDERFGFSFWENQQRVVRNTGGTP